VQTGTVNAGYSDNTTKYGGTNNTVGNSFLSNSTIQSGAVFSFNITNAGSGYTPGTYNNLTATGGTGTLLVVNIVVGAGGTVTAVVVSGTGTSYTGTGYSAGDVISAAIPGGSGFAATVNLRSVDNFTALNNISTFRSNSGNTFYTVRSIPTINQVAGATGNIYGFYHNPTLTNLLGKNIAFQNVTGDVYMGTTPGNVGIGTTNPSEKLAVKGNIIAQKIKVTLLGWSDYVFDSTYQLEPLHQVEKYIQQNKHLSGVPSAETVQKQGIDVGDNQAVLLKKIEELTLYVIEQNKKLEAQNERIKKLEENNQKQ
jgi:hypothetical protein